MTNELYHHGILGQKWGVRRFQNPDGSLTPAGRERYAKKALTVAKEARYGGGSIREGSFWKKGVSDSQKNTLKAAIKRHASASKKVEDIENEFFKNKSVIRENARKHAEETKNGILSGEDYPKGWPYLESSEEFEFFVYTHPKYRKRLEDAYDEMYTAYTDRFNSALQVANDILGQYANKVVKTNPSYFNGYRFKEEAGKALAKRLIARADSGYYTDSYYDKNGR